MRSVALGLCALAASLTAALAQPVFPPGSRAGLVPPTGMVLSQRFTGFESTAPGTSIAVSDLPASAFSELTVGFTREALARQGIAFETREDLRISDRPAILVTGEQQVSGVALKTLLLVISAPESTVLVVAQTRKQGGLAEADLKAALRTAALRPPLSIDEQMASLPFRLPNRAGFRPVRTLMGNGLLMTDGPLDVIERMEQPSLVIAASGALAPPPGEAREQVARAALMSSNQAFRDIAIERSDSFRLKGQDWHEIVARAVDVSSNAPVVIAQTIRFGQGRSVRILGITRADTRDRDLPRFRQVVDSIEID